MLAALRVLHVDPSHAPAGIDLDQGTTLPWHGTRPRPQLSRSPKSNRTKKTRRRPGVEWSAFRLWASTGFTPEATLVFLDQQKRSCRTARPAVTNPRISVWPRRRVPTRTPTRQPDPARRSGAREAIRAPLRPAPL